MYEVDYDDGEYKVEVFEKLTDGSNDNSSNGNNNGNGDNSGDDKDNSDNTNNDPPKDPNDPSAGAPAAGPTDTGVPGPAAGGSNDSGPDGDTDGSEKPEIGRLIKSGHGSTPETTKGSLQGSPLGSRLDSEGFGFGPHGNPGDNDTSNGRPQVANHTDTGPTAKQLASLHELENAAATSETLVGLGMATGEEGGSESWQGFDTRGSGKGKNDGSGIKNDKPKNLGATDSLGPRPDLVNPPHSKITSKTGGSKTGKTTNVLSAGLLDCGSSFSSNGPSGIGSIGSGHTQGAAGVRLR